MPLHRRLLAFGAAQATLALVALGGELGALGALGALLAPGAKWLLLAGAPALAVLAPAATTRAERALAAVLVAGSGLTVGAAFHATLAWRSAPLGDVAGAFLAVGVSLVLLRRLRDADVLDALTMPARYGFVAVGLATALLGGAAYAGVAAFLAALALVLAHVAAVDATRRVPGAVAAALLANPFLPALPLAAAVSAVERTGVWVDWATVGAWIALLALVVSALAPGCILLVAERGRTVV